MSSIPIAEISRWEARDLKTSPMVTITDVKQLASYNWIEAQTPTIAVPGCPPLWTPPASAGILAQDSGLVYIAQNAARHPDSPLEPLFRALYVTHPSFNIASVDIISDRNNIRKLLTFINPFTLSLSSEHGPEPFTINVEVTKNTAIFSREETATTEFLGPEHFRGFGREYEKVYTTSKIWDSTGHYRILSYKFDDLNFIIRHETDGYVDAMTATSSASHREAADPPSLLRKSPGRPVITPAGSKMEIREEGQLVPLEATLEIKTRNIYKLPIYIEEVAPQLWVSQTPKLVRAYHRRGKFEKTEVVDTGAQVRQWEQRSQADLRTLAALIKKIIALVKENGGNATVVYDPIKDKLIIRKCEGKRMLPEDLYSKWDDQEKKED